VIDDGSTDGSDATVKSWIDLNAGEDLIVNLYRQQNKGAPSARNQGIERAKGKYLQFLDSDDTLEPQKIENQIWELEKSGADVAVCDFRYEHVEKEKNRIVTNQGDLYRKLVSGWSISIFTPLIRANLVKNQLRWDERLKLQQDMDFIFKVMMLAPRYIYTPGAWCNYIQHDGMQISDEYRITMPQYGRRIVSLFHFMISLNNELPRGRKIMVVLGILHLAKKAIRYWVALPLKKIFGESVVRKITKYA